MEGPGAMTSTERSERLRKRRTNNVEQMKSKESKGMSSTERSKKRRNSLYTNKYLHDKLKESERNRKNLDHYVADDQIGNYVCVYYDEGRYWEQLLKVFSEDTETKAESIEITFLQNECGVWEFSKTNEPVIIEAKYVFMGPCKPTNIMKKGYVFEDEKARELYRYIKSKKD